MPWSVKDVDSKKKGLSPEDKKKWVSVANAALKDCQKRGDKDCEGYAIRVANSKFWSKEDVNAHNQVFAEADKLWEELQYGDRFDDEVDRLAKKKPAAGGANAGKYPGVKKFCGPAGGAPKGTYPVNTRGRASAAIAYARHAPNPGGIIKCVCRHWPDLPSCKKKNKQGVIMKQDIPEGAMCFLVNPEDEDCFAQNVQVDGDEDGKKDKLQMVAYSGKLIRNHWYWGDLAIDLSGGQFGRSKFPILENHDQGKKIAFGTKKPSVAMGMLTIEDAEYVDSEESLEFRKFSKQGFPYQASIFARPTVVEKLEEGATAQVNGFTMKGPGTIWRKWAFKEASVCVFGWDSNSSSVAFSKAPCSVEIEEITVNPEKEVTKGMELTDLTPETLEAEAPELVEAMRAKFVQEAEAKKLSEKGPEAKDDHSEDIKAMQGQMADMAKRNEDLEGQLKEERDLRLSREREETADRIWVSALADSSIPTDLHVKIRSMVKISGFVEGEKFDANAFATAVKAEVDDWESRTASSNIMGEGGTGRRMGSSEAEKLQREAQENIDTAAKLAEMAGDKEAAKKIREEGGES